jgi:hypothetical protein
MSFKKVFTSPVLYIPNKSLPSINKKTTIQTCPNLRIQESRGKGKNWIPNVERSQSSGSGLSWENRTSRHTAEEVSIIITVNPMEFALRYIVDYYRKPSSVRGRLNFMTGRMVHESE